MSLLSPLIAPMRRDRGDEPPAPPRGTYLGPETRPNPWWEGVRVSAHDHLKHAGHVDRERSKP